ncbi:MAG: hypothetical protein SO157_02065 [Bullifex sp.]|nr:hypothetical protein [Bullifex sp.]
MRIIIPHGINQLKCLIINDFAVKPLNKFDDFAVKQTCQEEKSVSKCLHGKKNPMGIPPF